MAPRDAGVCVIIAAFNAQRSVSRSVRSALAQKRVEEVIVCDDASEDDTAAVARAEDDGTGRLSVITLPENSGPAAARNVALAASRAPFVCVLDADDYFLPGRIDRLFAADDADWDILADDIIIVPERLEPVSFSIPEPDSAHGPFTVDLATFVRANISRPDQHRVEWGFLKPLMSREFLRRHNLLYDESLRLAEDYALYVRALLAGARFRVTGACGYVAIERAASISSKHSARDLKSVIDFDARCIALASTLTLRERAALEAHLEATQRKYDYRLALDVKRQHGPLRAIGAALRSPRSLPYIVAETLRARTASFGELIPRQQARRREQEIRLLIGHPASATIRYHAPGDTPIRAPVTAPR